SSPVGGAKFKSFEIYFKAFFMPVTFSQKNIMKPIISFIASIFLMISLSSCASLTPKEEAIAKTKAIEHYLEVVPIKIMMNDMVLKMAKALPEKEQAEIINFVFQKLNFELLETVMKKAMQKHFTLKEVNYMVATSLSPEGKSVIKKTGDYMAEVMPVVQEEMFRVLTEKKKEMEMEMESTTE
ncbi:MAG: DUF2059 domain-containing protein, partial [Methylococcales bacterium]|nr:DUF2059 domain-containing protein [Methylococcales bacterium]